MRAVFIRLALPEWSMSCSDCREWVHDDSGRIKLTQSQTPIQLKRPAGHLPPCNRCPKVPAKIQKDKSILRKWEHAADVAGDIEAVYEHYRRCKTVGRFPVDELIEEFAVQIADAIEAADTRRRDFADERLLFIVNRLERLAAKRG